MCTFSFAKCVQMYQSPTYWNALEVVLICLLFFRTFFELTSTSRIPHNAIDKLHCWRLPVWGKLTSACRVSATSKDGAPDGRQHHLIGCLYWIYRKTLRCPCWQVLMVERFCLSYNEWLKWPPNSCRPQTVISQHQNEHQRGLFVGVSPSQRHHEWVCERRVRQGWAGCGCLSAWKSHRLKLCGERLMEKEERSEGGGRE